MSGADREALEPVTEMLHRVVCSTDDNESCCWTREDEDRYGRCRDESGRWYRVGIEETILASDWLAQVKAAARAEGEAETREQVAQEIEAVAAMGVHAYEEPCFVDAALVARGRWQR